MRRVRQGGRPGGNSVIRAFARGEAALDEDRLVLSVNAPDSGAAEEELAVAYGDERLEIGFNAKYLLEIASQVDRENAVFLFNSSGDPTLMREGNDTSAVYVVMPMRV
jgi:DNA polymerase-3 subunit beta